MFLGTLFYRLTRVIYSRSPGWDPVLKVDRLTRVIGTLFCRLTRVGKQKMLYIPVRREGQGDKKCMMFFGKVVFNLTFLNGKQKEK